MIIKTAKGKEFECDSVTYIPSPQRLYFHLINTSIADVSVTLDDKDQLPFENYNAFNAVQSISPEGTGRVKVSLRIEGV